MPFKKDTRARSRSSSRSRSTKQNFTPLTPPADTPPRSPQRSKSPSRSKSPARSKSLGRPRSPGRPRSSARSRSPGRSKSPGRPRSPAQSRSRGRPRSPARSKSPGRARSPARSKSPARLKAEPTPPTRMSSRIAAMEEEKKMVEPKEILKSVIEAKAFEEKKMFEDKKVEDEKKVRKTSKKEFGGTIGVLFIMMALPAIVFALIQMCHKDMCNIWTVPRIPKNWKYYLDPKAGAVVVGWFFVQALLAAFPFGKVVEGQPLLDGTRLRYRCNGFRAFVLTIVMFAIGVYMQLPLAMVYDKLFPLMVASTILSLVFSLFFYIKSRRAPATALAPAGNTGNILYDFFMGHELNPRIGPLDLKFFFDLRMSMISWLVINLCFVLKANQDANGCPPALIAVTIFQGLYVADALWFEEAFLTTLDILHDGFGFMLAFGNLVYVPFLYSLQGLYLVRHKVDLPYYILAVITFLNVVGYVIFRGSNSQKNEFRRDPFKPSMAHLDSIPTISGKRLLVSGWWKLCRKPNYLGDIIMAVSWSLTCGFGSIVPYFYPIYVTIFLIHRERRDAANCQHKHGISWERYCNAVKYRIFPYVY